MHEIAESLHTGCRLRRARCGDLGGRNHDDAAVSSAVGRLMEALGVALTRDAASIPASVRRAALHLARELQTSPSPPMVESPLDLRARRDTNGTAAPQDVPFTASIRLGRMG